MNTRVSAFSVESIKSTFAWIAALSLVLSALVVISPADKAFAVDSLTANITQVSPAAGPAGIEVTITGTGFPAEDADVEVRFRSADADIVSSSSTEIVVEVPTGSSGLADITVETADYEVTLDDAFLYRSAINRPVVASVTPDIASLSGNTEVTIFGSNFVGVTRVRFGSQDAVSFRVESASKIVAVVPASTTSGNSQVLVTNGTGTSTSPLNLFYAQACSISTFDNVTFAYRSSKLTKATRKVIRDAVKEMVLAECGSVTLLRYSAKATASTTAAHRSYINLQRARATAVGNLVADRLSLLGSTATVRYAKFASQKSQATVSDWDSRKSYRKVTIASRASTAPAITASYPAVGTTSGGTSVTLKGVNLSDVTAVRFGSTTASFTVVDDDQITATAPAGTAGVASITIVAPTGTITKPSAFRYAATPTISSVSSTTGSAAGGATITITGTNFYGLTNVDDVRFGTVNASYFTVVSNTRITAVVPANSVGTKSLTISAGGGNDSENYDYRELPVIESISPAAGPTGVSTADAGVVEIDGENFFGNVSVKFGTSTAGVDDVNSSGTQIETKAPNRASSGLVDVTVTTTGGIAIAKDSYTYGGVLTLVGPESNEISFLTTLASGSYDLDGFFDLNEAFNDDPVTWEISLGTGTFDALTAQEFLDETWLTFVSGTGVISWSTARPALTEKTFTVRATQATPTVTATSTIKIEIVAP